MKKITQLFCLLIFTAGFAQTDVIENFDGTAPALAPDNGECTAIGLTIGTTQSTDANSLEIIAQAAGNPWQGAQVIPQGISGMDLTTTTDMTVDVYSTSAVGVLAKVTGGSGPDSATSANHTGSGWETLTFDFTTGQDNTAPANGIYPIIRFYPLWGTAGGYAGQGTMPCVSNAPVTIYIDNIRGTLAVGETCSDGILNNGETQIDCGGPNCAPCPPDDPAAAPIPDVLDGFTYSIYNDTNGYTNGLVFDYQFGNALDGEPDLDPGAGENKAYRFDFGQGGYGFGEGGPDDVSSYDFVSFDYYADAGLPGFRLVMISNEPGGRAVVEAIYQIGDTNVGDQIDIVTGAWTKVVIPMSYFTTYGSAPFFSSAHLFQWKVDAYNQDLNNAGFAWVDNLLLTQGNPLSVDIVESAEFSVYPNPTKSNWNIKGSTTINSVIVYDILGKQVTALTPNSTDVEISTANINTGVYFAKIESANGSKTVKLIKE
jgi:hypothetical protein